MHVPRCRCWTLTIVVALIAVIGCGDAAHREYIAALEGDEDGSSRAEQLSHIDRAIALAPDRPSYWRLRAIYRIGDREFEGAREDLDRAISLGEWPYLHFLRGLVLCQGGLHAESLADFDIAIEKQPENTQFYRGRSLARSAVGLYEDALEDAELLIAAAPQSAESYYARGVARAGLGDHEAAIADFDEALRRRPELIYPLAARAGSYTRIGDHARADDDRREFERMKQGEPHDAYFDPFRY